MVLHLHLAEKKVAEEEDVIAGWASNIGDTIVEYK
ncbi:MAG: hypothetical protein CM15mP23_22170 [Cryomorphaceae bacterium]|nr:MAG: hypothetical protein CM15mP23_22170 [Cryomorphaceae bacterium]